MCGRYLRRSDKQRIAEAFRVGELPEDFPLPPDYNVAPTTFQPVSRESSDREMVLMRWGLIPYFAKSPADFKGIATINARAESIEKSATWRAPFQRRRCLVPTDGFYEWVRPASRPDDCPAWSHDRTCRPIGSTLGGHTGWQRPVEKPSDNVPAAARLLSEPRGEFRSASTEADRT